MTVFGLVALGLVTGLALVVGLVVPRRARLAVWSLVVVAVVMPWGSWTTHAHWDRIEWIPFTRFQRPRDIAINLLLYVPLGLFFRLRPGGRRLVAWAAAYGFVLSLVTELTQVFSHGRFPTTSDLVMNTAGAAIGAWLARRVAN